MARRLIVNADGFGFGPGATQGVWEALATGGLLTSVSVNANFPEAARTRELVGTYPSVSVGVHLNPIVGGPVLAAGSVPSLVGPDGSFLGRAFRRSWVLGKVRPRDLEAELNAQIDAIRRLAGSRLTHLDSHQNSHLLYFDMFLRLAREWSIPCVRTNASLICLEAPDPVRARISAYRKRPLVWLGHAYRRFQMRRAAAAGLRMADRPVTVGYAGVGNKARRENWLAILRNLPEGDFEIYCHPAHPDELLARWATYVEPRAEELRIVGDPQLRATAAELGVELIIFTDLRRG